MRSHCYNFEMALSCYDHFVRGNLGRLRFAEIAPGVNGKCSMGDLSYDRFIQDVESADPFMAVSKTS